MTALPGDPRPTYPRIAELAARGRTRCPAGVSGSELLSCELSVSLFKADIWFLLLPSLPAVVLYTNGDQTQIFCLIPSIPAGGSSSGLSC